MRIITLSREFGSGGREVGKRLADELGFNYYDREIITGIAKDTALDEKFVAHALEKGVNLYPLHYGVTFTIPAVNREVIDVMVAQQKIIKELASKGDCVIVGRSADVILADEKPYNIFVNADMEAKIARCKLRDGAEGLTDKEIKRRITEIDKGRMDSRAMFTSARWGDKLCYNVMLNTTNADIKALIKPLSELALSYFTKK